MKLPSLVSCSLLVVIAFQVAHYAPLLPDRVASHFDGAGNPDGWSSKTSFLVLYAFLITMMAGLFAGIRILLLRAPAHWINLPHKEHWLAPERSASTREFLGDQMLWLGNVTLMFLSHTMGMAMAANLDPRPRLGENGLWSLLVYLAVMMGWTIFLIGRFYRRPELAHGE